jgi:hypothetical protein
MLLVLCRYTVKKGQVKAKITGFEGNADILAKVKEKLPVGSEFSFTWEVKGDAGTLDELKGDQADLLRSHLEGKYERKK